MNIGNLQNVNHANIKAHAVTPIRMFSTGQSPERLTIRILYNHTQQLEGITDWGRCLFIQAVPAIAFLGRGHTTVRMMVTFTECEMRSHYSQLAREIS